MGRPNRALQANVRQRARGRCEYCQFPESAAELPFHADHVIAEKHGGLTTTANLAWACFSCNMRKGLNIASIDAVTGKLTRLFHPRTDKWIDHFAWDDARLVGKTAIGRTTISVLKINDPDSLAVREALDDEGMSSLV